MKSLTTIGLVALAAYGATAQPKPIKDAMHGIYSNLQTDYDKGDAAAIIAYMSPEFKWKMMDDKELNFGDAKNEIKSELGTIQSGKWRIDLLDTAGGGAVAMTVAQYSFKGVMVDESKHTYNAEMVSTERQYWTRTNGAWHMTRDELVNVKFHGDGLTSTANILTADKPAPTTKPESAGTGGQN